MKAVFEIIEDYSTELVEFYTVRLEDDELTEYEKFYEKDFPDHKEEIQIIDSIIIEIGLRGAKKYQFKHEGAADAIPFVSDEIKENNQNDWGIRLYCVRVNENVVILLNGDIKTNRDPERCDNVKPHFRLSRRIARGIDNAIAEKDINVTIIDCLNHYEIYI